MIDINEYIKLPLTERQKYIKLSESCIERGGKDSFISVYCRGLLAHILNTTMPTGYSILLCHACNNNKCSNPKHLYWGTQLENYNDAVACGKRNKNIWQRTVDKYGETVARHMQKRFNNKNAAVDQLAESTDLKPV